MRVLGDGTYSIYVYPETGQPHHWPHCHVRWADDETVVQLPLPMVIAGPPLPKNAKLLLIENLEQICNAWNNINPERAI